MPALQPRPLIPGTQEFAALNNQRRSPLLKLPAEIRNTVFTYAFREHCILIRRLGRDKICFLVQPEDFSNNRRYPLSDLFKRAKVCRQLYREVSALVMRLNTFQLDHIESIKLFVERLYPFKLGAVKAVTLGMPMTSGITLKFLHSGLKRLVGLTHVVVDTKGWPAHLRTNAQTRDHFAFVVMSCIGEFLEIVFV